MKKVLFACGGTGGHIYPAVALAEKLKSLRPEIQVEFGGRKEGMEKDLLASEYSYHGIDAYPLRRGKFLENVTLPYRLLKSLLQAKKILKDHQIESVIATGGYVTLPYLTAARLKKIPCYLQEQNVYAGIANKIAGKWAKAAFVPAEDCKKWFSATECVVSGNPVRNVPEQNLNKPEEYNGFSKVLLVLGGSQGARGINLKIEAWLSEKPKDCLLVWQTGKVDFEKYQSVYGAREDVQIKTFIQGIYSYMKYADVIVSRAGASTIAELNLLGKGALFVPFPYAAENHQEMNARSLQKMGAALVELESESTFNSLVSQLLESKEMRENLDRASANLSKPNAAEEIVQHILAREEN